MEAFDNFTTVLLEMYNVHFWCISAVTFENYFIFKHTCTSNVGGTFIFTTWKFSDTAYETVVIIIWFVFNMWKWINLNFSAQFPLLYAFIVILVYFSYFLAQRHYTDMNT